MIGENKQLSIGKVRKLEIDNSGKKISAQLQLDNHGCA